MNIEELKLLAEEATPGPWVAAIDSNMVNGVFAVFGTVCKTGKNIDDAIYIAAANPTAILALIAERNELLAALKDAVSRLHYARDKLMDAENVIPDESHEQLSLQSAISEMNRHVRAVNAAIAKAEE